MPECEICYEKKDKLFLPCSHSLCIECYEKISITCPFCRHPIIAKIEIEKEIEYMESDPDYWLEYDPREWVTYSRILSSGIEIIRTFRRSEIPRTWRNDDLTIALKRNKQRKRRNKNKH